jgi:hypothetical protein
MQRRVSRRPSAGSRGFALQTQSSHLSCCEPPLRWVVELFVSPRYFVGVGSESSAWVLVSFACLTRGSTADLVRDIATAILTWCGTQRYRAFHADFGLKPPSTKIEVSTKNHNPNVSEYPHQAQTNSREGMTEGWVSPRSLFPFLLLFPAFLCLCPCMRGTNTVHSRRLCGGISKGFNTSPVIPLG